MNPASRATVVIRVLNEGRDIGACLDAILGQDEPCEILVIDSGSTDQTLDEVRRRPAVRLHEIAKSTFTFGRACNLGVRLSETEYVCFISGHALPTSPSWIRELLAPFADAAVAGVFGRQLPFPTLDPLRSVGQLRAFTDSEETMDAHFSNANSAVRKTDAEAMPFDEDLTGAEDWEWAVRVEAAGRRVRYAPKAEVYHSHPETLRETYRRFARDIVDVDAPVPAVGAVVREWMKVSRAESVRLYRHRQLKWALWAPAYFGARYAGDYRGRRRAARSRTTRRSSSAT